MSWRPALSQAVRELRIHICQKSPSSQGAREFIEKNYIQLKKDNPKLPILVRECSGVEAKMYARFDYGKEEAFSLANKSESQIQDVIKALAQTAA